MISTVVSKPWALYQSRASVNQCLRTNQSFSLLAAVHFEEARKQKETSFQVMLIKKVEKEVTQLCHISWCLRCDQTCVIMLRLYLTMYVFVAHIIMHNTYHLHNNT